MATQEQLSNQTDNEQLQFQGTNSSLKAEELLPAQLKELDKFGGFQLIKGLIKDAANMDPRRKAVKNIFLQDATYEDTRKRLKNELAMWIDVLEKGGLERTQIVDMCKEQSARAEENLQSNLLRIHEEIKDLEITYRTLDSFFANAGQSQVNCITLMNVDKAELGTHDSEDTVAVRDELEKYYDRLSLKNNYSLMVIPGYLGDSDVVRMWASTAYRNKILLITDFKDSLNFSMLQEELDDANLQGQDVQLANVVMTCNYILGRKKSELADEYEDVYIPASGALAGRMTNTDEVVIAQGIAGKKYGTLSNVKGARMEMRKSEIASVIDHGVVPIVEEDGRVMAFSNRSLYNGATMGLQEYPIVRVFDWIGKVFQNFFNDEAFINWNSSVKAELQQAIHDFLSEYKGPGKLIENYNLKGINQDPETKDISIQVELKPFFAAKNFLIELTGHNGTAGVDWEQNVQ